MRHSLLSDSLWRSSRRQASRVVWITTQRQPYPFLIEQNQFSYRARLLNWKLSLGTVLALIVLIIPFGMCLLFSLRTNATSVSFRRVITITSVPFSFWLVGLFTLGDWLGKALGVATRENWTFGVLIDIPSYLCNASLTNHSLCFFCQNSTGLLSTTLDRICVPGTVLIAALSGGAAVNSAWEAFEWRERFKSTEIVTDGHINAAIRSLALTRTDLQARTAEMETLDAVSADVSHTRQTLPLSPF